MITLRNTSTPPRATRSASPPSGPSAHLRHVLRGSTHKVSRRFTHTVSRRPARHTRRQRQSPDTPAPRWWTAVVRLPAVRHVLRGSTHTVSRRPARLTRRQRQSPDTPTPCWWSAIARQEDRRRQAAAGQQQGRNRARLTRPTRTSTPFYRRRWTSSTIRPTPCCHRPRRDRAATRRRRPLSGRAANPSRRR